VPDGRRRSPDAEFDRRAVAAIVAARTDADRRAAWEAALSVYEPMMRSLATRTLRSEDLGREVCHDAIVLAIGRFHTFDERSRLGTWLFRITYNSCVSRIRRDRLRRTVSVDRALGGPGGSGMRSVRDQIVARGEPAPGASVQEDEDRADVMLALDRLDAEQRGLLLLRDAQGLEYGQIAEVLGVAGGTIKSRMFRARAALRSAVEQVRAERNGSAPRSGAGPAGERRDGVGQDGEGNDGT
jgi:RNA polymerase sigma-70 factor (ECF subfamily)